MEKDFWLDKWKTADIAFHQEDINTNLIKHISKLNLQPGDCILVPFCGKTRDMAWLAEQGYHVVGVELSPIACQDFFVELNIEPKITTSKHFTKYQYKNIEILCADLFDLTADDLPTIKAIFDCKALVALPPEMRHRYVHHIEKCAGSKNNILLLASESPCVVKGPPFSVDQSEVNSLYGSKYDVQQIASMSLTDIPQRLINKGYEQFIETVYLLAGKN